MRDWIEEYFDWSETYFYSPPGPILPTREFFTAGGGQGKETATMVLQDIQRLTGIDRQIHLMPLEVLPAEFRIDYNSTNSTAGTFQETSEGALIQYDPDLLKTPLQFINVIVHEIMHVRLSGLEDDLPGGYKFHELATDLSGIVAGFGAIQLQAADDAGWTGYLRQTSRAYALAVFLKHRGLGVDAVSDHLSPRCTRLLRKAFKGL